jgi:Domain of unknown function (DUF4249)
MKIVKIHLYKTGLVALLAGLFLSSCNLTRDVEVDLPLYERQPVVECYLEPGKPFRLLLTQSYSFFDKFGLDSTFLEKTLLQEANISISYDGKTVALPNFPSVEFNPLRIYNYSNPQLVPATPNVTYTLNITLKDGRTITGQTIMLPRVPIDSNVVEFGPTPRDTTARMLTYLTDDLKTENFYRRLLNYSALDSVPDQDFLANDRILSSNKFAFGTGYELSAGDTVFSAVFHITKAYYDYLESVQLAVAGNQNPFAQPSPIKSNVRGNADPLGIFTCLVYDRDTIIVKR